MLLFLSIFRTGIHEMYPNKFVQMDENRFRIFNTLYELPSKYWLLLGITTTLSKELA